MYMHGHWAIRNTLKRTLSNVVCMSVCVCVCVCVCVFMHACMYGGARSVFLSNLIQHLLAGTLSLGNSN